MVMVLQAWQHWVVLCFLFSSFAHFNASAAIRDFGCFFRALSHVLAATLTFCSLKAHSHCWVSISREKSAVVPSSRAAALVRASFAAFQALAVMSLVTFCRKLCAYAYRTCWSANGSGTIDQASSNEVVESVKRTPARSNEKPQAAYRGQKLKRTF